MFKKFNDWANSFVSKLSWIDCKLIVLAGFSLGVICAYLFSKVFAHINIGWYILVLVLCYMRLMYVLFRK